MALKIRPTNQCEFDHMALGETMIRLSPPDKLRIEFAPYFEAWVGGGEYNAAYALSRYGLRTGWISRVVDNPLGKFMLNHARAVGMDVSEVVQGGPDGPELHRGRPEHPRERDNVRPRPLGGVAYEAGRGRLQAHLR